MDTFDGSNMCNLCSNIPDAKTCLPSGFTCDNIDNKLKTLYGSDTDKLDKLEIQKKEFIRKSKNFKNEDNSLSNKYNYLVGACDSYCNMFNIQ